MGTSGSWATCGPPGFDAPALPAFTRSARSGDLAAAPRPGAESGHASRAMARARAALKLFWRRWAVAIYLHWPGFRRDVALIYAPVLTSLRFSLFCCAAAQESQKSPKSPQSQSQKNHDAHPARIVSKDQPKPTNSPREVRLLENPKNGDCKNPVWPWTDGER